VRGEEGGGVKQGDNEGESEEKREREREREIHTYIRK